jgi:transposase
VTKFTVEQKINTVDRYQRGNENVRDIAKSLGANHEVVRMWIKQFEHRINAFEKRYTAYPIKYK